MSTASRATDGVAMVSNICFLFSGVYKYIGKPQRRSHVKSSPTKTHA